MKIWTANLLVKTNVLTSWAMLMLQISILIFKLVYYIDEFSYKENVKYCQGSNDSLTHTYALRQTQRTAVVSALL